MITYKKGDILTTKANSIIIPVNVEGNLTNKVFETYPQLHKQYISICKLCATLDNNMPQILLLGNILSYSTKDNKHILLCFCDAENKYWVWAFERCASKILKFLEAANVNLVAGYNNDLVPLDKETMDIFPRNNCWNYYSKPEEYFYFARHATGILIEVWIS